MAKYVFQVTNDLLFLKRGQGRAHFCMLYPYGLISSYS
jgi:hypothetical protein